MLVGFYPHHFTHHLTVKVIGWSTFCCTCRHRYRDAFPLGSTVPCGVRTFLPAFWQGDDPADTLSGVVLKD